MGFESSPKPVEEKRKQENAGAFRMDRDGNLVEVPLSEATRVAPGEKKVDPPIDQGGNSSQESQPNITPEEDRVREMSQEEINRMIEEAKEKKAA